MLKSYSVFDLHALFNPSFVHLAMSLHVYKPINKANNNLFIFKTLIWM